MSHVKKWEHLKVKQISDETQIDVIDFSEWYLET